jgi:hypothetical protein
MNKSFLLPGNFVLTETANAPGSIEKVPGILEKARSYGAYMEHCLSGEGQLWKEE